MIKERAWPARAMYLLIAAALAISLLIVAAPPREASAQNSNGEVAAEWTQIDTPTLEGFVLAPESEIIDYALAEGGDVAYAIIEGWYEDPDDDWNNYDYRLLKSDNGAATWTDITKALWDEAEDELFDDPDPMGPMYDDYISELILVATDWVDPDFVAVALEWYDYDTTTYYIHVFISDDGGDNFKDAKQVWDNGKYFWEPDDIADLAISYEDDGEHEIAIGGLAYDSGTSAHVCGLFRCTVDGDSPEAWKDATAYDGWDDEGYPTAFTSVLVTDILFSYKWELDRTILVVTATNTSAGSATGYYTGDIYLQSGVWGTSSQAWNEDADFAPAVPVVEDVEIPFWLFPYDGRSIAGVAIPIDYDGSDADMRYLWVWMNYYDSTLGESVGMIYRVRDGAPDDVDTQISKNPWLTNVSYMGYKAEGKAIAGVLAESQDYALDETDLIKDCCEGVQVYRNGPDTVKSMEICCNEWDSACKPPTGQISMAVSFVSEEKAYAVALGGVFDYDEGAWSVTFDDGDTFNQLSLVDTYISYLSDVAVSPDCNKTMLVSVNDEEGCECDSVWLHAEDNLPEAPEYTGYWIRTWNGEFEGDDNGYMEWGLLRLAPEETNGDTVYLVDYGTDNVYYNSMETWACWKSGTATVDEIVDLAVKDEATIFAVDYYGDVAMSDGHGAALTWTKPIESQVAFGNTIAVWDNYILVGGQDGDVSYTDNFDPDAEDDVFTELDETTPIEGLVCVAFDSYFDQNMAFYAAVDGGCCPTTGGIYLWVLDESEDWTDIDACHDFAYTGLVLDNADGNPMTSPETGGVLYASFIGEDGEYGIGGVARTLTPIVEICCDVGETEWDYLVESDPEDRFYGSGDFVDFDAWPDALKICGCLTPDSNSHLFAVDNGWEYDMEDHEDGGVWTFEDCYSKHGIELTGPEDGDVIPADPCECDNVPFSLTWDRLCDACCYEFEFALDEDFTQRIGPESADEWRDLLNDLLDRYMEECCRHHHGPDGEMSEGACCVDCCPVDICPEAPMTPSWQVPSDGTFVCEFTYYWRVRATRAETGQCIRSWWSEPMSFTIAPSRDSAELELVSPVPGSTDQPTKNVGFSWDLAAEADTFSWELKKGAVIVDSAPGLTDTYYEYAGPLDYSSTYNWQVIAYKNGSAITMSAVGTFTTGAHGPFCCPQCGLCFETEAELQDHIDDMHPAQPATPVWVWVVIGIGAALVIVVIVLIFRTRRV